MPTRWNDRFREAERDLEEAEDARRAGRHEWACFAAHQAAERRLPRRRISQSTQAIEYAGEIVDFVHLQVA